MVKIAIEVDTIEQVREALRSDVDAVLLDNMTPEQLREAVDIIGRIGGRVLTEASGGVTLENVKRVAQSGVNLISVGRITHSAPALDLSLEIDHR
jgi:nicotinate-nucleotide pyrophosphorylase (carboxylating)